ncbi:DUF2304 domain-containing protein [Paenibacillus typhae]|uniref:DUF2304 domain-containing protein n=1 Tax=Paenibacillus typhae TaxID=1174501 RepID=UPI001C8EA246|nr:DUF2304 domain-containing protein [Paenibacillus typhae]MBY0009528.1 DUF2304 domain-containing protein [Paenibacillus typhae]
MFPLKLQLLLLFMSVLFLLLLINMIKKYELQLKYALLWFVVVLVMIIVAVFPGIAFFFTDIIGIQDPSNFVFLLGILSCLVIIFSLSISISTLSSKMRQMSQEIGLLKYQFKELQTRENQLHVNSNKKEE